MPIYNAPLADMKFILNDVFNAEQFWQANENLAHIDAATAEAILEEMAKFAQNVTLPINRTGDEEGATFSNGNVTTPAGFKEAFKQYAEGGWIGLGAEEEFGGQFHEGTKFNVNISVVAKRAILAVLFDSNSSIGLVRLRVRRASEEMTKVFDDLVHKIQQQQKGGGGSQAPNIAGEITDDDIDKLFGE